MALDTAYFAEFSIGITNAWTVGLGNWVLYEGLGPVVFTASTPAIPFRIAVTVSAATGHTDVVGSIVVGSETLTFTKATRLTTTTSLTALPVITLTNLDCNILVEAITANGAPIDKETLTAIEIICFPKTSILKDPSGSGWMQTNYDIWSEEPLAIGDQIRFADPHQADHVIDIFVKNVDSAVDLEYDNTQPFRHYNCA